MTAPTSEGVRGMGTKIGAGPSGDENRPLTYNGSNIKILI